MNDRTRIAAAMAQAIRGASRVVENDDQVIVDLSSIAVAALAVRDTDALIAELARGEVKTVRKPPAPAKPPAPPAPEGAVAFKDIDPNQTFIPGTEPEPPARELGPQGQAALQDIAEAGASLAASRVPTDVLEVANRVPEVRHSVGDACPGRHIEVGQRWVSDKSLRAAVVKTIDLTQPEKLQVALRYLDDARLIYTPLSEMHPGGRWRFIPGDLCIAPDCQNKALLSRIPPEGERVEGADLVCVLHQVDESIRNEWVRARLEASPPELPRA